MTEADAAQIARLNVGDKIRLKAISEYGYASVPRFSTEALFRLVRLGFADPVSRGRRGEIVRVKLTAAGKAIRAELLKETKP